MRIKEVQYQRLFTLGNYNNERIGFVAEVNENEDANKVLGELFFKVLDVEDCLETYRFLLRRLDSIEEQIVSTERDIARTQSRITELKITIDELVEKIKQGDYDARLRHACETESLKELRKRLEDYTNLLKEQKKQRKELEEKLRELRNRIQNGNFSLEGLEIQRPKQDFDFY